jgi:hypothetical protein
MKGGNMGERKIPATNEIQLFIHCKKCLEELPEGKSPREYAELEAGFTPLGVQIWCKRHEVNVVHIDFEKQKHPANLGIAGEKGE